MGSKRKTARVAGGTIAAYSVPPTEDRDMEGEKKTGTLKEERKVTGNSKMAGPFTRPYTVWRGLQ